jgi:hypothetical protein
VDRLLFAGIMLGGLIIVGRLMLSMRMERLPRRLPPWLALAFMVVSGTLLVVSLIGQYWLTAAAFALNFLLWVTFLVSARRQGAS